MAQLRPLIGGAGGGAGDIEGVTAGAGLTGGGTTGTVTLDVVAAASSGLTVSADDMTITLQTPSGLELGASGLAIDDAVAGTGLSVAAKVLSVDYTATGFSGLAGDGLAWDAGNTEIDVGAGDGLTVSADAVALTTPGTLTAATSNAAAGNHTHAITDTSDASATPSTILSGDASGDIFLRRLQIDDRLIHDGDANTYLEFTTDQLDFILGGVNMFRIDEATNDLIMMGNGADLVMYSDDFSTETARIASDGTITGTFSVDISGAAGLGLVWDAGDEELDVGAGDGITVNADDVALTTPGTLTAATSNSSAGSHTHAITDTSDAAGTVSTILSGDASGDLFLRRLQVDDRLVHDGDTNTYIEFTTDQVDVIAGGVTMLTIDETTVDTVTVPAGFLGVGVTPTMPLQVRSTAAIQFALQYDASNDADFSVSSGGTLTARADLNLNLDATAGDVLLRPGDDVLMDPTGLQVDPIDNYSISLGQLTKKYLALHAAELVVENLVAHDTMATIGGRILVGPTTELTADLTGAPSELLSNPGFETAGGGGADIWGSWTENAGTGALANETTLVNSGSDAAKMTAGSTANTYVYQSETVTAGDLLVASFWTRGDGTYDGRYWVQDVTNSKDIIPIADTGVTGTTYTYISTGFRVPPGCTTVRLFLYCPSTDTGVCYFDDASLYNGRLQVKHNNLAAGDIAYMESGGSVEFLKIWAGGSATYGGSEIVLNPGFETAGGGGADVFANWTENDDSAKSTITQDSGSVHGGTYSCKITTDTGGSVGRVQQAFTVTPWTYYKMSFWTRADGGDAARYDLFDITRSVFIGDSVKRTLVTGTTWTQVEYEFLTSNITTSIQARLFCTGTVGEDAYFDDVSLLAETGEEFEYTAERNLDGSGLNAWTMGDAVFNTGAVGDGFIDLYSRTGVSNGYGPAIVGNIRNSDTYNDWSEHWALGNLNGLYGYSADTMGLALGGYQIDESYLTIDSTNGIRIFSNDQQVGQWATDGDVTFGEVATDQGNAHWNNTNKRMEFRGGTNGTVVEAYIDTNGSIVAGGGNVSISSSGVDFEVTDTYGFGSRRINLSDASANLIATIDGRSDTSPTDYFGLQLQMTNLASGHTSFPGIELYSDEDDDDSKITIFSAAGIDMFGSANTLDQFGGDGAILSLISSDVAHGATHLAATDVYGTFSKADASAGGMRLQGIRDSDGSALGGLILEGYLAENASTTKSQSGYGITMIKGKQTSGATTANTVADGNVVSFHTNRGGSEVTLAILDGDGDLHVDGGSPVSTFDAYDDAQLVRAFDVALELPGLVVDREFGQTLKYNATDLERLGILHPPGEQGERFYNVTRLGRLHNGAIWQLYQDNQELRQRLEQLEARI